MPKIVKGNSALIVPCIQCGAMNRIELEYTVTEGKDIVAEAERKKQQEELDAERNTILEGLEGKRVRPDDSQGKHVERITDNNASDSTGNTSTPETGSTTEKTTVPESTGTVKENKKPGKAQK